MTMKFADAVQLASNIENTNESLWLLTSYQPSTLRICLQATLIEENARQAPRVETTDFDTLFRVLDKENSEKIIDDSAILSLLWEDLDPSCGWRNQNVINKKNDSSFNPSSELMSLILNWASMRSSGGAKTVVVLPPLSWIPNPSRYPREIVGRDHLRMHKWRIDFGIELEERGVTLLDPGNEPLDLKAYLYGGCPWSPDSALRFSRKISSLLYASKPVKAIIVDLDNTLWPGTLEDGSAFEKKDDDAFAVNPHHELGKCLSELRSTGLFIACSSKNDLSEVKESFGELSPYLTWDQFSVAKINWDRKSTNVNNIIQALNILPEHCLFIDDNPAEILEVKSVFPEIQSIRVPTDIGEWPDFLETLRWRCIKLDELEEDKLRLIRRPEIKESNVGPEPSSSSMSYLKSLSLSVDVREDTWMEKRTLDLINKTNQFNLNGNPVSRADLSLSMKSKKSWCYSVNLEDIYGSFGTIGVVWGKMISNTMDVEALALSCRAFERHVEFALLHSLISKMKPSRINFQFKKTGRNSQALKFLDKLGINPDEDPGVETKTVIELLGNKVVEAGIKVRLQ